MALPPEGNTVYTIGHSSRITEEFLDLLLENKIQTVVDVRRFPGSRRYPHFGSEQLERFLNNVGVEYRHVDALGGRRAARPGSPNDAWRNPQFRGYADHMDTDEFRAALADLVQSAAVRRPAIMCAEALPWQCHRQLIADALVARGVRVLHIIQAGKQNEHELSPHARTLEDGRIVYPAGGAQLDLL
jgi:uncharacterized protein (DUF488 family)